ncbi:helix-turn-helix transcriptional regulator [Salipiger mangrovisoli]|uniref:Helix-turn-helix transcriptional regulator n=1 Tax=Salipiger mangrovisoli TaxID=2865933 RepID=A0ABR9WW90_9RHOB|nr:AraC family transcriptional regulator [Salipiger mangrovisoli]MBE9635505.1 helix-turn-helix transcriptional regulator [Salipiger mangrovisoli]
MTAEAVSGQGGIRLLSPGQQPAWAYGLLHDRPETTLLWLTRGQGKITLGGVRRGLGTHSAVLIPPRRLFALDLGPQSLALILHAPGGDESAFPDAPVHLRVRDALAQAELTSVLESIQRELSRGRPHLDEALAAYVRLAAVWLRRQRQEGISDAPDESAAQRLSEAYAGSVVAGYRCVAGPGAMAAGLGVTGTHLTRACRASCGRSAQRILSERKLHEAQRLLLDRETPVATIAAALGFASPAYFTRFIRKQTGRTPSELRAGTGQAARPVGRSVSLRRR